MSKATARKLFDRNVVKAHFVLRGTTVHRWSHERGFKFRHVYQILSGYRKGLKPEGRKIVLALRTELRRAS